MQCSDLFKFHFHINSLRQDIFHTQCSSAFRSSEQRVAVSQNHALQKTVNFSSIMRPIETRNGKRDVLTSSQGSSGVAPHIFRVRGHVIGKGIDFYFCFSFHLSFHFTLLSHGNTFNSYVRKLFYNQCALLNQNNKIQTNYILYL